MIELKTPQSTNFCHREARASVLARTPSDCGLVGWISSLPPGIEEGSGEPRATRRVKYLSSDAQCSVAGRDGPAGTATVLPRIYLPCRQITTAPSALPSGTSAAMSWRRSTMTASASSASAGA